MEKIIEKINQIEDSDTAFDDWSLIEKKKLLEIYFIICKKENHIFDLIWQHHGCDSWEDIFRDYDERYLQDKAQGVKIAIKEIQEKIEIAIKKIQEKVEIATKEIHERIEENNAER